MFGVLALGWRGAARHWQRYEQTYYLLAALATPLVVSVHSVVSFDFAVAVVPGWHSTIFPPYFVAGALFSGFAMALVIAVPLRAAFRLRDFISDEHLAKMGTLLLVTGLLVAYSYAIEIFTAFYSGDRYATAMIADRYAGPYAPIAWSVVLCNVVLPQALWSSRIRRA